MSTNQGKVVAGKKPGYGRQTVEKLASKGAFISEVGAVKRDAYSVVSSENAQASLKAVDRLRSRKSA